MARKKKQDSPAIQLLRHVWQSEGAVFGGHSWDCLNSALGSALFLAIRCGFRFDPDDFKLIASSAREGGFAFDYWGGRQEHMLGERFYSLACNGPHGCNRSAAQSFEAWEGRAPFILQADPRRKTRSRIAVGHDFLWYGERYTCTSFAEDGSHLVACTYQPPQDGVYERKIKSRIRITHDDIRAYHKYLKSRKAA